MLDRLRRSVQAAQHTARPVTALIPPIRGNAPQDARRKGAAPVIADESRAEKLHDMVAVAAYYLAERRNFEPGHELGDCLTAEAQVWTERGSPKEF